MNIRTPLIRMLAQVPGVRGNVVGKVHRQLQTVLRVLRVPQKTWIDSTPSGSLIVHVCIE